jgi:hypothetical protein
MSHDEAMQLLNLSTGDVITPLNKAQLDELKAYLEQESFTDTSFYITSATLDFLRARGADELAVVLENALDDAQEIQVGYAPISSTGAVQVSGRLLTLESNSPLTGYKVEVYDEDIAFDDLLGWCYSDPQGEFGLRFEESAFKDSPIEGEPELELRILDVDGVELGWIGILRATEVNVGDIFVSASRKVIAPILDPAAVAVCPNCGAFYRFEFSICSDCQVLVRPLRLQHKF